MEAAVTRGGPDERRRVTVPERMVTGDVSPTDIVSYLLATGWSLASCGFYERDGAMVRAPFDDASPRELETLIGDIASREGRSTGEVLRDIEALACEELGHS
jgi:hypothetical protein